MKEFLFNENDNIDLNKIAEKLFINTDSNDPSSIYYNRRLDRPRIYWLHIFLHVVVPIVIFMVVAKIFLQIGMGFIFSVSIPCIILLLYILLSLRKILICFVHIYQHFAPSSIRMKCRYEPSCSQYMIMAIEKYGVLKGLRLGLNRLSRCKVGNGGYDFP